MSKDNNKIRVVNKTGNPADTKVFIGKKQIALSKLFRVAIVFDANEKSEVHLELIADSVDVIGKNLKAVEKLVNEK